MRGRLRRGKANDGAVVPAARPRWLTVHPQEVSAPRCRRRQGCRCRFTPGKDRLARRVLSTVAGVGALARLAPLAAQTPKKSVKLGVAQPGPRARGAPPTPRR